MRGRLGAGLVGGLVGFAGALTALVALAPSPPPVAEQDAHIVRMLDMTVVGLQDKNTTNRRQRFECLPVREGKR